MERTQTRTKALKIEGQLLNKISVMGSSAIADAIGVDRSQITRWKESFIPKISMLLAVLEWGVVDDDLARLAKEVAKIFKQQKPRNLSENSQLTIEF